MTSLLTQRKQIPANGGYYINVGNCSATFYANTSGSDSNPTFSNGAMLSTLSTSLKASFSTLILTPGAAIFRDHGKTLVSSSRTFRKVQLMVSTGNTEGVGGAADGVNSGVVSQPSGYLTGYIELPGTGGASSGPTSNTVTTFTPVARLG